MLRSMLDRDRVPHSLLFHGPAGVGKATVAVAFAAGLLCHGTGPPCGHCDSCHLVSTGNHPDLLMVKRLPKRPPRRTKTGEPELATVIAVDQIRAMSHLAGQSARLGGRRVILIDEAERMNANAQNALLKTLEEPAPRVIMILVASRPQLLLPTVRSRCLSIRFAALRTADLAQLLERMGYDPQEASSRAALADGCPGLAIEMDVETQLTRREQLLSTMERMATSSCSLDDIPPLAALVAGRNEEDLMAGFSLLQGLLRDAARAAADSVDSALVHQDIAPRLKRLGVEIGQVRAAKLVESVDRARNSSRFNVNRLLLAEGVLAAIGGGPLP